MDASNFIAIGENIHCTRIVKRNGKRASVMPDGSEVVSFTYRGEERTLAVPPDWGRISPAFEDGKIKHVALAVWGSRNGEEQQAADARDYLCSLAEAQIAAGARFLDVNVDEFSSAPDTQADTMAYLAGFLADRFDTPLSIDSSKPKTLNAGLARCREAVPRPMVNSVSLERTDAIPLVQQYNAAVVVSASGREGLPADASERIANFREIIGLFDDLGIARDRMYLDPLVLPISTDPGNGMHFFDAVRQARAEFDGVHITGGLSNVSFGMPSRKLLNMTFVRLCAEAGADSGIIDPVVMPPSSVAALDPESEPFKLAKAVLTGEDMFGMEFITAFRDGRLG